MFKQIISYISSNFLEAILTFLFLPIFTQKLNANEYGTLVLYLIFAKFLLPIVSFNLNSSASVEYFKRNEIDFLSYIKSLFVVPIINFLILTVIIFLLYYFEVFSFTKNKFIIFIPLFVFSQHLPNLYTSICQAKNESFKFGLFRNLNSGLNFLLVLLLLFYFNIKIEAQILGFFIGNILISLITFYLIFKNNFFKIKIKKEDIKFSFNFGITILFHALSGVVISMSDRFIIEKYRGLDDVGVYSVGYQIATIITIIATGVGRSLVPTVYQNLKINTYESKIKIVKYVYFLKLILLAVGIFLILFNDIIFYFLVDVKFHEAKKIVLPLILGLTFQGFYMFISSIFFYNKKNSLLSILTFSSAVFNIILNIYFVSKYGYIGAAWATFYTYLFFWIISWIVSNRVVKLNWLYFFK